MRNGCMFCDYTATNGTLKIYEKLGMTSGNYTSSKKDSRRVQKMEIKMSTEGKSDRKRK